MEESRRARRGALVGAEALLVGALIVAPLALGTVHLWSLATMAAIVSAAALAAALARPRPVPWPVIVAFAVAGYAGLQVVPLPRGLLQALSPRAVDLLEFSIGPASGSAAQHAISLDPAATAREFARLLTYALALFTASRLASDERSARRLLHLVAALTVLQCVAIVAHKVVATDAIYGRFPTTQANAVLGTFGNANHLCAYLTLGTPLLVALGVTGYETAQRVGWLAAAGVACLMVVCTSSRSGLAGMAAALALTLWLLRGRLREVRRPLVGVGVTVGIGALFSLLFAGKRLVEKLAPLYHPSQLGEDVKVRAWRDVPALVRDYWATGIGRGAFETVFPAYKHVPEPLTFTHAENAPLQLLSDFGVLVGSAVMAAWVASIVLAVRRERSAPREDSALRLAVAAALAGLSLHELADFSLDISGAVGLTTAVLAGLLWPARRAGGSERLSHRHAGAPVLAGPRRELRAAIAIGAAAAGASALVYAVRGDISRDVAAVQQAAAVPGADIQSLVREAIRRHPGEPWFARMAALDRLRHRKPLQALPYLNRALVLDPTAWQPHHVLAEALLQLGKRSQALLEFRLAYLGSAMADSVVAGMLAHGDLRLDEIHERFVGGDAAVLAAFASYLDRVQRDDAAADAAQRLLAARPGDTSAIRLLARVELRRRRFAPALDLVRQLPPGDAEALLMQVQALDALGRGAEADVLLEAADDDRAAQPLALSTGLLLADRALARNRPAAALSALDRVVQDGLAPAELASIHRLRGRAFEEKGRMREALLEAEHAARLDPSEATWLTLGDTYERVGLLREALLVYRGAVRSMPVPSEALRTRLAHVEEALSTPTLTGSGGAPGRPAALDELHLSQDEDEEAAPAREEQ